ncbi:hypothetical protein H1W37_17935 [Stappia taiwanensis]|uniref:Uncharacterized protein n=1 Tax=Stappia taiwanensis TaxID=992267 RepID=A0A838XT43_9HYPH|nr:hypothetical protein [Stappia taiwanensis]MBA4613542.1 hypothetical protein [Stappia taiwanensis]GGE96583.1 hypothetical protein GCM10007285_25290 [Stappia taiwanensis]
MSGTREYEQARRLADDLVDKLPKAIEALSAIANSVEADAKAVPAGIEAMPGVANLETEPAALGLETAPGQMAALETGPVPSVGAVRSAEALMENMEGILHSVESGPIANALRDLALSAEPMAPTLEGAPQIAENIEGAAHALGALAQSFETLPAAGAELARTLEQVSSYAELMADSVEGR